MKTINYKGRGEHSVNDLELIIEQQAEELHLIKSGQKPLIIDSVSKRYIVATDINYLNEIKVISHTFEDKQDAESFMEHCKETDKYKNAELIIINVC